MKLFRRIVKTSHLLFFFIHYYYTTTYNLPVEILKAKRNFSAEKEKNTIQYNNNYYNDDSALCYSAPGESGRQISRKCRLEDSRLSLRWRKSITILQVAVEQFKYIYQM